MTGSSGASSTPRLLDSIATASGILDHPHAGVMTTVEAYAPRVSAVFRFDCHQTSIRFQYHSRQMVFPAEAGSHNQRCFLSSDAGAPSWRNNAQRWLWVPDRARDARLSGTTWMDSNFKELTQIRILAARCARAFAGNHPPIKREGAGKAGCRLHPWVPCNKKHGGRTTGSTGIIRPSLRNGFNGFLRALLGDRALLPPSLPRSLLLENLTPASGRQDHTTSPSASRRIRLHAACVHRIPRSTSVTIAIRPSARGGTTESIMLILANHEAKYFSPRGWTGICEASPSGKSVRRVELFARPSSSLLQ